MFRQTVSQLTAKLDTLANKLLEANDYHSDTAKDIALQRNLLQEKINYHSHEADRALRIHGKISKLLS